MTGPHSDTTEHEASGRPISVAELLARNGTIGAPAVTRRRRRRRGDSDAVTVAELTGEIPVVRDPSDQAADHTVEHDADAGVQVAEPAPEPEPRWPKSPPPPRGLTGPERSAYPRPLPHAEVPAERGGQSGAEDMSPDPLDHYADIPVDVMDSEVRDAEPAAEDSAYVRSYLGPDSTLFGGQTLADEVARRRGGPSADSLTDEDAEVDDDLDTEAEERRAAPGRFESLWRGSLIVFQSILAVAFGAGLFVAFDELWRWNSIVALVLSVLVILGLVVGVRVVRKTEDIASTLIAVAVGAMITLGPLVLSLQSG
ncbi:hypothetical protein A5660_09420 [Mycobacterium alsense]|uniref:hypothetical protein n=1 Tax=Mycobacterium alsense TaxID=324058 RepID=UPI0007FEAFF5|nr:hypothetical protein [Mycobacterium alsense]OBI96090.1 hypothetical protein A5660_09420 [Mycobacterium alsense]